MKKNDESINRAVIALKRTFLRHRKIWDTVFQNFTSKSNKLMVMVTLTIVTIRSNPKTWLKTISIFQGDILEN